MKKIICLCLIFLALFSACQQEEMGNTVDKYTVSMQPIYTERAYAFTSFPFAFDSDIYLCIAEIKEDLLYYSVCGVDTNNMNEKIFPIEGNSVAVHENCLYHCLYEKIYKTDIKTAETEIILDRSKNVVYSSDVAISNGIMVWWESDESFSQIKYYAYNLETQKTKLIAETNYFFSPNQIIKLRNGYMAYSEKSDDGFNIYGVNIRNGKKVLLLDKVEYIPRCVVYDGNILTYSGGKETSVLYDGKIITMPKSGGTDTDIFAGNYIIFCGDRKIFVYDLIAQKLIFSSEDNYSDFSFCQWFSLDENSGKAAFYGNNWEVSFKLYPDWNYDVEPDIAFYMSFNKTV